MPRPNAHKILRILRRGDYTKMSPAEWKRDLSKLKMDDLRQVIELLDKPDREGEGWERLRGICIESMMTQNDKKFLS